MTPLRVTKPEKHDVLTPHSHASSSPPIPFHKQLATPRLNIGTDKAEAAVVAVKKADIKVFEPKKLEARYKGILLMCFVCYMAAIAFFSIMFRSLFHQHANTHGVAPDGTQVATIATLDTSTETSKGHLEFLQAIGHFKLQEDLVPLLPLNAVKEMLSDNKHILDTIEQELGEIIHDVLI